MSDHDLNHLTHLSFEDAYAQLEKLVEQLETNSLPLEESLSLFEEGQQLSAYCQQLLDKADLRVSKLAGNAGELVEMVETNGAGETKAANKPDDIATSSSTEATAEAQSDEVEIIEVDVTADAKTDDDEDEQDNESE